jgi:ABC-type amino acid transport substrate-binding protein
LPDAAADWQKISDAGKIVVGTAVDYPPFEYYDAGFQLDGFDPALLRAIAQQLGVEVEFVDLAFDGLGQALVLGQIDVAISALSETPERARLIDFTNPYFVSTDAYLTRVGSSLTVTTD